MIENWLFISAVAALGVILYFRQPQSALCATIIVTPMTGLFVDVGVSMSAARIFQICGFGWLLLGAVNRARQLQVIRAPSTLAMFYLTYGCVVTLVSWAYILGSEQPLAATERQLRELMRGPIQCGTFVLAAVPFFVARRVLTNEASARAAMRSIVAGGVILSLLGIVQWALRAAFGYEIFGIYRQGIFGDADMSYFFSGGSEVYRINSLAREPKDLGVSLVVALFALLTTARQWSSLGLAGLMIAAIVLTYSTSAAGVMLGALVGWLLLSSITGSHRFRERVPRLVGALVLMAILASAAIEGLSGEGEFGEIFTSRITDRSTSVIEEYDQIVIDMIVDRPQWALFGLGVGMLPFYSQPYLPTDPELLEYVVNVVWDAKAGILKLLGSLGIVGTAILATVVVQTLRALRRFTRGGDVGLFATNTGLFLLITLAIHSVRAIDESVWIAIGIVAALAEQFARNAMACRSSASASA